MKIKVCGLTRAQDARLAASLGAWALGFVFWPASPRAVTPAQARAALADLPRPAPLAVGVFVDRSPEEMADIVLESGITAAQLHGAETPADCERLRALLPGIAILKAFRLRERAQIAKMAEYASCDALLVDSYAPGVPGGTGAVGDWSLARLAPRPVILAGGLRPENVREAAAAARPFAVDASSGLEDAPGVKSAAKMRTFFARASNLRSPG